MRGTIIIDFDDTLFDCEAFKKDLDVKQCARHLFPDARDFLMRMKSAGFFIVLLSRGEVDFQQSKFVVCGIDALVDQIIVGPEPKPELAARVPPVGAVFFINDKIDETRDVIAQFSVFQPILKRRPDVPADQYRLLHIPSFDTLTEIVDYIYAQKS